MTIAENCTGNVSLVLEGVYHTDESDLNLAEKDTTPDWCDLGTETETKWEANKEER